METEVIGAIIGGIVGYIISIVIVSPKFRHEGGGWFSQEGGMGFFKGCLVNLVFIAIGALAGYLISSFS